MTTLKDRHPDLYGLAEKPSPLDEILDILRKLLDFCLCCITCGCYPGRRREIQRDVMDTELSEEERVSVRAMLKYLDSCNTDLLKQTSISTERLRALCILTYSANDELQRSAALCFAEFSERMHNSSLVEAQVEPLVVLLRSRDLQIQKAASLAISNFALNGPDTNKAVILNSGTLEPLVQLLQSENTEVQCNVCGCITTLATTEKSKQEVMSLGGVSPLLDLATSKDIRVKRNATGALLNLTHLQSNRNMLVSQGALPTLVEVLHTDDPDVQYYSAAALSNMAVNEKHRAMMVAVGHFDVIFRLIQLLSSPREKVKCQVCLALRNLASDAENQMLIVQLGCLPVLHNIMRKSRAETLAAAVACLRNLSIHRANENQILEETLLGDLKDIVQDSLNIQAQIHASGTLRNLAAGEHIHVLIDNDTVEALVSVLMDSNTCQSVLTEVTAALAVLTDEEDARNRLLASRPERTFQKLVTLAKDCQNLEVCYNCAGAIGQLSLAELPGRTLAENTPGLTQYLQRFLSSAEPSHTHIALWTLNQLMRFNIFLEAVRRSTIPRLVQKIVQVNQYSSAITDLAESSLQTLQILKTS